MPLTAREQSLIVYALELAAKADPTRVASLLHIAHKVIDRAYALLNPAMSKPKPLLWEEALLLGEALYAAADTAAPHDAADLAVAAAKLGVGRVANWDDGQIRRRIVRAGQRRELVPLEFRL